MVYILLFICYYLYIVLHIPLMLQSFLDADQDRKNIIFANLGGPAEPWEGTSLGGTAGAGTDPANPPLDVDLGMAMERGSEGKICWEPSQIPPS